MPRINLLPGAEEVEVNPPTSEFHLYLKEQEPFSRVCLWCSGQINESQTVQLITVLHKPGSPPVSRVYPLSLQVTRSQRPVVDCILFYSHRCFTHVNALAMIIYKNIIDNYSIQQSIPTNYIKSLAISNSSSYHSYQYGLTLAISHSSCYRPGSVLADSKIITGGLDPFFYCKNKILLRSM